MESRRNLIYNQNKSSMSRTRICGRDFFKYYLLIIACCGVVFLIYNFGSDSTSADGLSRNPNPILRKPATFLDSSDSSSILTAPRNWRNKDEKKFQNIDFDQGTDAGEEPKQKEVISGIVKDAEPPSQESAELPEESDFGGLTEVEFNNRCLSDEERRTVGKSISDVYNKVLSLRKSRDLVCQNLLKIFDNLFEFERISTSLQLPEPFKKQVRSWLGNDEELFEQIYDQKVFKVVSMMTGEETIFNLLRSRRPVSKSGINPVEYVENLTRWTQGSCDFCKYKEHTAEDVFGRIENKFTATASNTFKLAKFHGLFFPLAHHPLNISYDVLEELFLKTSDEWFRAAHKTDTEQRFGSLLWDSLPHAGASQVHPHVHGMLDNKQYAGIFETIHKNAKVYNKVHGRSICADFVTIHVALGLGIREGNAFALVPITARKDHEFWIISEKLTPDVTKLLYRILQAYRHKLNIYCHSSAAAYPPLSDHPSGVKDIDGLPVIFRIGSRGDCTSDRSDVSSLELYTVNNINSNLAETMQALEMTKV